MSSRSCICDDGRVIGKPARSRGPQKNQPTSLRHIQHPIGIVAAANGAYLCPRFRPLPLVLPLESPWLLVSAQTCDQEIDLSNEGVVYEYRSKQREPHLWRCGPDDAPIAVAAFVEAHEALFQAWLQGLGIDPVPAINGWRRNMAVRHHEILGLAQLNRVLSHRDWEFGNPARSRSHP